MIFQILKDYIWSDELKNQGRMNAKDFIRNRVLTFPVLVSYFINIAKKSLQVSLNEFCKISDLICLTKQAFSKARQKLSAQTFILLNRKLVEEYYSDNIYLTWKGFRVVVIDGSDIQLPRNEQLKVAFGAAQNQNGAVLAMAKMSNAYDVLNHLTLDAQLDYYKTSERDLAVRHIEKISQFNHDKIEDLYIFDRGYPALWFLFYLNVHKKNFLFRSSISSCIGEIKQVIDQGKEDFIIRLYANDANKDQIKQLNKYVPKLDRKNAYIDVRAVIVLLSTGEKELLITSLIDNDMYPKEELKILYGYRWGGEENYKWQKVAFELENFSGNTKLAIEQEVFSLVLTANMASLLVQEAQEEIDKEYKTKSLKYDYKINKRIAVATVKDDLLKGILDRNTDMQSLCERLKEDLKNNLCPVRPNRQFKRPKKGKLKYGSTMRRSI